jgi:hypothetical protein
MQFHDLIFNFSLLALLLAFLEWGLPTYLRLYASTLFRTGGEAREAFYNSYRRGRPLRLLVAFCLAAGGALGMSIPASFSVQVVSLIGPLALYAGLICYFVWYARAA